MRTGASALLAFCLLLVSLGLLPWLTPSTEAATPVNTKVYTAETPSIAPPSGVKLERGAMQLKVDPYRIGLKQILKKIVYLGINERPDAHAKEHVFQLEDQIVLVSGEREIQPTIFLAVTAAGPRQVDVRLHQLNSHCEGTLTQQRGAPLAAPLVPQSRQFLRLVGKDLFLEQHGGPEMADLAALHRLDFGPPEEALPCYVQAGDRLIFKDNCWSVVQENTQGHWLMVIHEADDMALKGTLWSPSGCDHIPFQLTKAEELFAFLQPEKQFRFVGAKSSSSWIFDLNGLKTEVRSGDWWLFDGKNWSFLDDPDQIDAYAAGKAQNYLLVFDEMGQQEGKKVIHAHLFNRLRNDCRHLCFDLP